MAASTNIFIINGHGTEKLLKFNDRKTLPSGYTLVTFTQCGNISYLEKTVDKVVTAFMNPDYENILSNPKSDNLKVIFGKKFGEEDVYIYREGDKYPPLSCEFFLDWEHGSDRTKHYMVKSGLYKYPLLGDRSNYLNKKVIDIKSHFFNSFDEDKLDQVKELYSGAIYPSSEDLEKILSDPDGKFIHRFRKQVMLSIDEIFEKGGPGIYYWPVCRGIGDNVVTLNNYTNKVKSKMYYIEKNDPVYKNYNSVVKRYDPYRYSLFNSYNKVKSLIAENKENPKIPEKIKEKLKYIEKEMNATEKIVRTIRSESRGRHEKKGGTRKYTNRRKTLKNKLIKT